MWLLRILVIAVLFVQVLWMLSAAGLPIALLLEGDVVGPALEGLARNATAIVRATSTLEVVLSLAALFFFVIALVRLVRRTQAFMAWLLGFLCLLALRSVAGIATDIGGKPPAELFNQMLANLQEPTLLTANLIILGAQLLIGIAIIMIDVSDKRHWTAHAAQAV
ncbi:MAG: hypothetical protein ACOYKM_00820 [Caulobacterales bacterium]|jgi:hypothetical protein